MPAWNALYQIRDFSSRIQHLTAESNGKVLAVEKLDKLTWRTLADRVALGGVFRAQQLGDENRLDPETVAASVRTLGIEANVVSGGEAMADFLAANAKPNDLLLIMSNGSFDGLCEKLLTKLAASRPVPAGATRR